MSWWEALLLGLIEGVTEYLPVSSTGHLLVAQRLLGIGAGRAANAFAIAIQSGAVLAVLALYPHRIRAMLGGLAGRSREGRRLLARLLLAFLPAAAVGLLFADAIEARLFGPVPVAAAWIAGGLLILLLVRWPRFRGAGGGEPLEALGISGAVLIGLAQALALWPGTSRSLVTIVAAVLVGLSLRAAVEFSFLLGLVTLGAATAYTLLREGAAMVASYGWLVLALGFLVSFASAFGAMRWMIAYLERHGLALFGWWRLAAGVLTLLLLATNVL